MLIRQFLLALAYFTTGWLGLLIPYVGSHITLVWLPTGIAVAAFLKWGRAAWPGVFVGAILVNLAIGSAFPLAAGIAVGNMLGPLLTSWILKRAGFHPAFDRQRDVGMFVAAAVVGMALSAFGGVTSLYVAGLMPLDAMSSGWLTWWMGDTVGVLMGAPLLLTLTPDSLGQLRRACTEVVLWLLIAGTVAWLAFIQDYQQAGHSLPMAFLTLPLLAWAALRFGISGAALGGLFFSLVAAWSTAMGHGTFHVSGAQISLFLLWSYMATTVLTGLLITALQAERRQVESTLRESRERLLAAQNYARIGYWEISGDGRTLMLSEQIHRMFGLPHSFRPSPETLGKVIHPGDYPAALQSFRHSLACGKELCIEYRIHRVDDGTERWMDCRGKPAIGADGKTEKLFGFIQDITERKQLEQGIAQSEQRMELALAGADLGLWDLDIPTGKFTHNPRLVTMAGYAPDELEMNDKTFLTLLHPEDAPRFGTLFYAHLKGETPSFEADYRVRHKDGHWIWILSRGKVVARDENGRAVRLTGTNLDITERKTHEAKINDLAFYDPLTRLPNRRLLLDRLGLALPASGRHDGHGAILFLDLDNFKTLNDTRGHECGDLLLVEVARRLLSCVRAEDTVARLGGDEFVVMLVDLNTDLQKAQAQAEAIADIIRVALAEVYTLNEYHHHCSSSIGISMFKGTDVKVGELIKRADIAMYQAKSAGRNTFRFFEVGQQA